MLTSKTWQVQLLLPVIYRTEEWSEYNSVILEIIIYEWVCSQYNSLFSIRLILQLLPFKNMLTLDSLAQWEV